MDAVYEISTKETTSHPIKITYDDIVEEAIKMIQPKIETIAGEKINSRWVALKLLDNDGALLESLNIFPRF